MDENKQTKDVSEVKEIIDEGKVYYNDIEKEMSDKYVTDKRRDNDDEGT